MIGLADSYLEVQIIFFKSIYCFRTNIFINQNQSFMKKSTLLCALSCFLLIFFLTSSFPVIKPDDTKVDEKRKAAIEKAGVDLSKYTLDKKLSYKELKDVATTLKGKKLSLKEKIAFKLFGKKISNKAVDAYSSQSDAGGKSQVIALILCILVGTIGIHRFYLGYTWQGIVQLLTLGVCGIWSLIDLIRIITGDLKPKNGEYGSTL